MVAAPTDLTASRPGRSGRGPAAAPAARLRGRLGLPVPALFRPAGLLVGFTLDLGGPVTAYGREAIAVTAVPRHGAVGSGRAGALPPATASS
jgi:hypothetical protein